MAHATVRQAARCAQATSTVRSIEVELDPDLLAFCQAETERRGLPVGAAIAAALRDMHRARRHLTSITVDVPKALLDLLVRAFEITAGEPFDVGRWVVEQITLAADMHLQAVPDGEDDGDDRHTDASTGARLGLGRCPRYDRFVEAVAAGDPEAVRAAERAVAAELAPAPATV